VNDSGSVTVVVRSAVTSPDSKCIANVRLWIFQMFQKSLWIFFDLFHTQNNGKRTLMPNVTLLLLWKITWIILSLNLQNNSCACELHMRSFKKVNAESCSDHYRGGYGGSVLNKRRYYTVYETGIMRN